MIGRAGQMRPSGKSRPSISAKCGRMLKAATARVIARSAAPRMLIASISSTLANTIETLSALAKMISHKCSRLASGSALESSTPNGRSSGSRMTAATPTGPARGRARPHRRPRPIDSRRRKPRARNRSAAWPPPGAAARRTPSSSISTPLLANHAGSSTLRLSQRRPASQDGELAMPVDTNTGLAKRSYPNEPSLALVKRWKRPTRFWTASHLFSPPSPMRSRLCSAGRARGAPLVRLPTTILASTSARAPDSMLAACSRR